jgi:hypothetical protein
MKRPSYLEQIRKRIYAAAPGSVFIPSDFFDITEAVKVNMCLTRLTEKDELNRMMRGVFAKPRYSTLLNVNVPPHTNDIAKAIARKYGWTIIPCGDTALNMLGLSAQVPSVWLYVSDGPYKTHHIDGITLKFKHTDKKNELLEVSYQTALMIQALRALGKNNITDQIIHNLSNVLGENEKRLILCESQRITAWIYEYIKKICAEDFNE